MKSTLNGCFFYMHTRQPLSTFWLCLWSVVLAAGWLLPNHYLPWLSFHADAWVAGTLLLASATVILRSRVPLLIHQMPLLVALLICIVWLQYGFGLVSQAGIAWIGSIYLFGFLLALLVGARWEASCPGQLGDGLFLAVGIAAILSVGLQLRQWFQLDGLELWTLGSASWRPHANLGQPNQLGTLLLWGVLAAVWGVVRRRIDARIATLMAAFLLFGVALTGSRTAWLGVALLVAAAWLWRHLWSNKWLPWAASGLALYFVACVMGLGWLQQAFQGSLNSDLLSDMTRMGGEIRPLAWSILLDALWQKPWDGYGWGQIVMAQMAVAERHPYLGAIFSYSHNLFFDMMLWFGIPVGLLILALLLQWLYKSLRAVKLEHDAVLLMFLLVIGNHALLELPLYYGYFLLPVGLVIGAVNVRLEEPVWLKAGNWFPIGLLSVATMLLSLVIRDYTRVEPSYRALHMEWQGFQLTRPKVPPDVLLLTQWRDYIRMARVEPRAGLNADDLQAMRNGIALWPTIAILHKLATSLALNQQPDEARLWLQRMCKVIAPPDCAQVRKVWVRQSLKYPEIAAIPWPIKKTDLAP